MFKTQTGLPILPQLQSSELRPPRIATALRAPSNEPEWLRGPKGFLLWAFILAQAAAAELLLGGGAKATEVDDNVIRSQPQADLNTQQSENNPASRVAADEFAEDDGTPSPATLPSLAAFPAEMLARSFAPTLANSSRTSEAGGGGSGGSGGGGGYGGGSSLRSSKSSPLASDDPDDAGLGPISGGGGVLNGSVGPVEIGIGPLTAVLDPLHVTLNPLGFSLGAEGNLGSILGFNVRLSSEGLIVSPDLDLNALSIDELVSDVVQIVGPAEIDLSNLRNVDVAGLGNILDPALAELTGLQLPGIAPLQSGLLEGSNAVSSNEPPIVATVIPGVMHLRTLGETGNTVSGGTFIFPEQPLNPVASLDHLFAGNQHTDYGMALRAIEAVPTGTLAGGATSLSLPSPIAPDHAGSVVFDDHDAGAAPKLLSSSLDDLSIRSLPT